MICWFCSYLPESYSNDSLGVGWTWLLRSILLYWQVFVHLNFLYFLQTNIVKKTNHCVLMSLQKHDQDESMMTIANNTNSNHIEKPKMLVMSWQLSASFFQVTLWTHSWTINPWPKSFITRDIIQHVQIPPKTSPKQSAGFIHGTFTNKRNNCLCNQRIIEGMGDTQLGSTEFQLRFPNFQLGSAVRPTSLAFDNQWLVNLQRS